MAQLLPAAQTTYGYLALHSGGIDIRSRRTRQRSRSTGGRKGVKLREYVPVNERGAFAWKLPKKMVSSGVINRTNCCLV
jgi:hypothetical protein